MLRNEEHMRGTLCSRAVLGTEERRSRLHCHTSFMIRMSLVSGNGRWLVAGAAATAAGYGIYQYLSSRKKTKPTGPQPDGKRRLCF